MAIERLRQSLNLNSGSRFFMFHGPGVHDIFIGEDYISLDIEEALHGWLLEQGFERIVFYRPRRGFHFRDAHSRSSASPSGAKKSSSNQLRHLSNGVLGRRSFLREAKNSQGFARTQDTQTNTGTKQTLTSPMGDAHVMRFMDAIMRESNQRSVIIIHQAETTISFFSEQKILANVIGEWAALPLINQNICIFLFSGGSELLAQQLGSLPELRTQLVNLNPKKVCNTAMLGGPDINELQRLIDYARLIPLSGRGRGVQINWLERKNLTKWLSAEAVEAKRWLLWFREAGEISRKMAKQNNWLSSESSALEDGTAQERLAALPGLMIVKEKIAEMTAYIAAEARRKKNSTAKTEPLNLHLVFAGNPGTGKTTVARLIGEIYRDMGLLRRGHTVAVEVSDLVAGYVGQTAIQTNAKIDEALDGVLFIDEAYQLSNSEGGNYGQEAINALLTRMENQRDRLVVIVAGYPLLMKEFIKSNPGLSSRFENVVNFPDYNEKELMVILRDMLNKRQLQWSEDADAGIHQIAEGLYVTRDETFGNAREMRKFAQAMVKRQSLRVERNNLDATDAIQLCDVPEEYQHFLLPSVPAIDDLLRELNELTGLNSVKESVSELLCLLQLEQSLPKRQSQQAQSLHMVFTGNPGTGKTTVARLMGRIFQALGLLRKGHTVEVNASDLVAGYIGQTGSKTKDKIDEALDGVLFIDEAYTLARGGDQEYGPQAVDQLVKQMEDNRDRLVVIIAGYPKEINHLLNMNPGLPGRFNKYIDFPDYSSDELMKILRDQVPNGLTLSTEAEEQARDFLEAKRRRDVHQFDNGRAVRNLLQAMKGRLALRLGRGGEESTPESRVFKAIDVPEIVV